MSTIPIGQGPVELISASASSMWPGLRKVFFGTSKIGTDGYFLASVSRLPLYLSLNLAALDALGLPGGVVSGGRLGRHPS